MLLEPRAATLETLKRNIDAIQHRSHLAAEQAFLNEFFKDNIYELPVIYNAFTVLKLCEPATWYRYYKSEIKLLHFTMSKPWTYHPHSRRNERWWDAFSCWFWGVEELCALWDLIDPNE